MSRQSKIPHELDEHLKEFYPHFGVELTFEKYKSLYPRQTITNRAVMGLRLRLLPKSERICIVCRSNKQSRRGGFKCQTCDNTHRQLTRYKIPTLESRFNELLRTARYRNTCEIDLKYLMEQYAKQKGKCYYSKILMELSQWGRGRHNPFTISLEKVIPTKGYIKGNVVLVCWGANCAKNEFSMEDFITIAKGIAANESLKTLDSPPSLA